MAVRVALGLFLLAASACSAASPADRPAERLSQLDLIALDPVPPGLRTMRPFYLRARENYILGAAEEWLTSDCMRARGLTWTPWLPTLDSMLAAEAAADARLYGISDPTAVEIYGYAPLPEPQPRSGDPNASVRRDPQYRQALGEVGLGSPASFESGCVAQARRAIFGVTQLRDPDEFGSSLGLRAFLNTMKTRRFEVMADDWARCMAQRVRHVTPRELFRPRFGDHAGQSATESEIDFAMDDLACRDDVRVTERWARIETDEERALVARHKGRLERERLFLQQALARAEAVLAEHEAATPTSSGATSPSEVTPGSRGETLGD